jgi:hypothetical protein
MPAVPLRSLLWHGGPPPTPPISLNGVAFNLKGLRETVRAVAAVWDGWDAAAGKVRKRVKVVGATITFQLEIVDYGTDWADSTYNTFKGYVGDDVAYSLLITLGGEERVNTTVKVRDIDKTYDSPANAIPKYRRYSLTLQEV